ncbi:HEAT repeat domain-containing protein [Tsukamurella paurometabola]|uniref:HEAT repeat domain-containing protein n=1 Tax=Tsukamurella paurometabola TaxID=2061 RepID=A0A3P8LF08_TSUPA|nr:HEAT repeat domain-containing protein [Tsukamurella paurometabola]UEA82265.1 HEAT repeat domain-containing protein [Tsukamurella paurometabola]VDR39312.1 Uncharacterised protein [Tsukamurella paurometabola]
MTLIEYPGMPEGDDWRDGLTRFVQGERGFDIRIVDDLEAVGVRAYTVSRLRSLRNPPRPVVDVYADWLGHLDDRVPGPETRHRENLRTSLILVLDEPSAKGNRAAIEALFQQLARTDPPLPSAVRIWAMEALCRIATKDDYDRILALARGDDLDTGTRIALVRYLGRFRRPESRDVARDYLQYEFVNQEAIRALGKIGTAEDVPLIEQYADDPNPRVRRAVGTALKRLRA